MAKKTCEPQKLLYESLKHCDGTPVLSGVRRNVLFQRRANIVSWPTLPAITGSMETLASYVGDFTLAELEKWKVLQLSKRKGKITSKPEGEKDNRTYLNEAELPIPDNDEYAAGFARAALNDELVFLVQQQDGKYRVLGSENFDVDVSPEYDSGEGATGSVITSIKISARDVAPAPFYTGKIETEDGVVQGGGA